MSKDEKRREAVYEAIRALWDLEMDEIEARGIRKFFRTNGTDDGDGVYFDSFVDDILRAVEDAHRP